MALYTFSDPMVRAALAKAVLLQADVTHNTPAGQTLLRQFDLIGPPAILFLGRDLLGRSAYGVIGHMKTERFLIIVR